MEEIGRIAIEADDAYPRLLFVKRLPKLVESALLMNYTDSLMYNFTEKAKIKEGGKTEHILYDRNNTEFSSADSERSYSWLQELLDSVKSELKKKGLTAEKLFSMSMDEKTVVYESIARVLGINAMERQEDVQGFIELIAGKIER
jgi:hypothetical protein